MSTPHVELRFGVASDLEAILALERATESAPHWPPSAYALILGDHGDERADAFTPRRCLFVALRNNLLAGFAVGLMSPPPNHQATPPGINAAELESVVVAASARRSGIGRALCRAVLDWCKSEGATEVTLEVRAADTAAIALYSALEFNQSGERPRYYRNPHDDALLMCFRLDDK